MAKAVRSIRNFGSIYGGSERLDVPDQIVANILLVDDHQPNLLALEAILRPLGQRLIKVSSGHEALRAIVNEQVAVVLLDVRMPGLDGFRTAELIREAELDHLARIATAPAKPIRSTVADWLFSLAERIDDRPHPAQSIARAEA